MWKKHSSGGGGSLKFKTEMLNRIWISGCVNLVIAVICWNETKNSKSQQSSTAFNDFKVQIYSHNF